MDIEKRDFNAIIKAIQENDSRYSSGAYYFLREALDYTIKDSFDDEVSSRLSQHITGQELLEGIKQYALERYGPMAFELFKTWGVNNCKDFGNIVFNLVDCQVLGKNESDSPKDFEKGYNFKKAFQDPFVPEKGVTLRKPRLY